MLLFWFDFGFNLTLDARLLFLFLSGDETSQYLHAASLIHLFTLDPPFNVSLEFLDLLSLLL